MNLYAGIILAALFLDFALNAVADHLNLKALQKDLPAEAEGFYDPEKYRKSQDYLETNTRFDFIVSTFELAVVLVFWFAGGFNWLDLVVRGWRFDPVFTGVLYVGVLMFSLRFLMLPFSLYSTFAIEERFGFNKTTPKTFAVDLLKGAALSIVLGVPLLAGVFAFFESAGDLAWLYCWGAVVAFTLILQFIAPTWIMPLFNKFTPLEEGELRRRIFDYSARVGFPLTNVFVIDGSRRSNKSNAFFTGFGKNKRIALFDTLVAQHSAPELEAVMAHEIGHYKKKHIPRQMAASVLHMGLIFYLLSIFLTHPGLFEAFYMENHSVHAGMIFFIMLFSPLELVLSIILQGYSRRYEFEADRFAAETIADPENMATALKKLSVNNLSNLTPHPFYVFLKYSHPPVLQRIDAIRRLKKIERGLPEGSTAGV